MINEAKSSIQEAGSVMTETVRANPIPLALIGFGIAWMVANGTGVIDNIAADERVRTATRRIGEAIGAKGGNGLAAAANGQNGGWVHQAADAARGALRTVTGSGSDIAGRASKYAADAGDRACRASGRVSETIERHPLLLGALGLVSGAAIATLLPMGKNGH